MCSQSTVSFDQTRAPNTAVHRTHAKAACAGDCDGSGTVTINEIVTLVGIALEQTPIGTCAAGNPDGNLQITVSEVLTAVNRAIRGCAPPVSAAYAER